MIQHGVSHNSFSSSMPNKLPQQGLCNNWNISSKRWVARIPPNLLVNNTAYIAAGQASPSRKKNDKPSVTWWRTALVLIASVLKKDGLS